ELKELQHRVEDALSATRAAMAEGIVAGGGSALLHAESVLDGLDVNDDYAIGVDIVRQALSEPAYLIAANAGYHAAEVVAKTRELGPDEGFDALEGRHGNMIEMGIIDPLRVVRSALQNGASVAGLLLTTNTLVAEEQTPWGGSAALVSQFGYMLLWVVLAANLMAMLVQSMSAKLGIATGRSLPEVCRDRFPFRVVVLLWLQAEAIAMATALAEFVGAALGLHLVFGLSLWISAVLTGVAAFTILGLQVWGFRRLEATITGLVAVVVLAFGLEILRSSPSGAGVARGLFVPQFSGGGSALLAVGIVGATVMPHVIYLHSSLTQKRIVGATPAARRKIFRFEMIDISIAMGGAGLINLAMLATAAAVFHARGLFGAGNDLGQVFAGLNHYLGAHSGTFFGVALLA